MKTLLPIGLWIIIWYLNIPVNANSEKALIFNREKNSLIAAPTKNLQSAKCGTWVTACPAEDDEELKFQEKYSFNQAALFVKDIYEDNEENSCGDFKSDVCANPYKLSIAWFRRTIEFGYEIFLKESDSVKYVFDVGLYDSYESLKYFLEIESSSWLNYLKKLFKAGKKEETVLKFENGQKMEFIWIPLIKVWFKQKRIRKIEYQIQKNNVNAKLPCKDYDLGKELLYGADVDSFYSIENQQKAFADLDLPLPSTSGENRGCKSVHKCLTKWLLMPADQFQFNASSLPSCSNIITVPIWSSTIEGILQKLDEYLYALSRVSGVTLRIVAGVSGILTLPGETWTNSVYFSHGKFSVRAPNVIYKIVKFRVNRCERGFNSFCWYGVLIAIHNDPYYNENKPICEDRSEELGWSEIKYEKLSSDDQKPSKFIYVCRIDKKSIQGVGLTYDMHFPVRELSLVKFPDVNSVGVFASKNVKNDVFNELKRLYESTAEFEVEQDEVIERSVIYDEDFNLNKDIYDEYMTESDSDSEEPDRKTE